jgi:hypothetical protein
MPLRFKDSTGDEWSPRITCLVLQRVQQHTGVNLLGFQAVEEFKDAFKRDIGLILRLAFHSCETEAVKRGVSFDDFCDRLTSRESLFEAVSALMESMALFIQPRNASSETPKA